MRQYRERNREALREYHREYNKAWRMKNPGKTARYYRRWAKANPKKGRREVGEVVRRQQEAVPRAKEEESMRTAVIVCPGPSFKPADVPSLHALGDVYALNRAIHAWKEHPILPKAAFFLDELRHFDKEMGFIRRQDLLKIGRQSRHSDWDGIPNVRLIVFEKCASLKPNPFERPVLASPMLSTLVAWQMLVREGYSRIYIVGCECRIGPSVYFCEWKGTDQDIERRRRAYKQVFNFLHRWVPLAQGVETINLSPTSRLKRFMRTMTVAEAVGRARERD